LTDRPSCDIPGAALPRRLAPSATGRISPTEPGCAGRWGTNVERRGPGHAGARYVLVGSAPSRRPSRRATFGSCRGERETSALEIDGGLSRSDHRKFSTSIRSSLVVSKRE
jgi:hypothetical protein